MSVYRILLRSVRRYSTTNNGNPFQSPFVATTETLNNQSPFPNISNQPLNSPIIPPSPAPPVRTYGFSSAEEAAAERRRRKRRLRIEPPLYALRPNPPPNSAPNPNAPRLPDSTSALTGPRLNLHNRVQSLIRAGDLDHASYVARQAVFSNVRPTVFTCNAIIAAMYRAKRYSDAKALFQYFFNQYNIIPNVVSYNNLIVSHCESNEIEDALKVYQHILENAPFSPSAVTYRHLTKGLIDAGRINDAVDLLREMLNKGHGADSLVYNNLIQGFLNLGNLDKANELFDELKERCTVYDGVVNATFMEWYFKQGKPKEAMESYRDLMDRSYRMVPATRNVLLEKLLTYGKKAEALALFEDMLDDHTPPTFQAVNSDTFNMMVNECFNEGKVEEAMEVFKKAGKKVKSKPFQMDVAGFNNMIARLCEIGMMEEAEKYYKQLCDKSLSPDVNTYRTMIDAYIKLDMVEGALQKYTKMVDVGLRVIPDYANKWFGFLIEKGKVSDCVLILTKMSDKEPRPDVTTYDIVLRGLIDEGNYDATANLLRHMINNGVGTTSTLREFVLDAFEKQGRRSEVQNILNSTPSNFTPQRSYPGPPRNPLRTGRPPQVPEQGGRPTMPWHGPPTQMSTGQMAPPQMPEQGGRPPAMPWQAASNQHSHVLGPAAPAHMPGPTQMPEQGVRSPVMGWQPASNGPSHMAGPATSTNMPGQIQMPEQWGRPSVMPWHTASDGPSNMAAPAAPAHMPGQPQMPEQGGRPPIMPWPAAVHGPPHMAGPAASTYMPGQPQISEQGGRVPNMSWQAGFSGASHMAGPAAPTYLNGQPQMPEQGGRAPVMLRQAETSQFQVQGPAAPVQPPQMTSYAEYSQPNEEQGEFNQVAREGVA